MSPLPDSDVIKRIRFSLRPLKEVEDSLTKRISGSMLLPVIADSELGDMGRYHPEKASEVQIRSGTGWKNFIRLRRQANNVSPERAAKEEDESNRRILQACADDIATLWSDKEVQATLADRAISLKHQPGLCVSQ